ncbi:MAG: hypothetical protein J1F11_01795 [Oscillospiraceae bacterium]|nr:hypothetical protein [Oscillospiraceae bacterium]
MKLRKIIAGIAAAAVAASMMAVNAFAATVQLDTEYPGAWSASKSIPKSEFEAIGGDVKVVLSVELKEPLIGDHNHLAAPMDASWNRVADRLTSDTAVAKSDGMMVFCDGQTSMEFVVPADVIADLDENGLSFLINDVIIKSAELSEGTPQAAIRIVTDEQCGEMMSGKSYEEVVGGGAAPADDAAPAGDGGATTAAKTGNASAAAIAAVMAAAGAAAVAAKKRK